MKKELQRNAAKAYRERKKKKGLCVSGGCYHPLSKNSKCFCDHHLEINRNRNFCTITISSTIYAQFKSKTTLEGVSMKRAAERLVKMYIHDEIILKKES